MSTETGLEAPTATSAGVGATSWQGQSPGRCRSLTCVQCERADDWSSHLVEQSRAARQSLGRQAVTKVRGEATVVLTERGRAYGEWRGGESCAAFRAVRAVLRSPCSGVALPIAKRPPAHEARDRDTGRRLPCLVGATTGVGVRRAYHRPAARRLGTAQPIPMPPTTAPAGQELQCQKRCSEGVNSQCW